MWSSDDPRNQATQATTFEIVVHHLIQGLKVEVATELKLKAGKGFSLLAFLSGQRQYNTFTTVYCTQYS